MPETQAPATGAMHMNISGQSTTFYPETLATLVHGTLSGSTTLADDINSLHTQATTAYHYKGSVAAVANLPNNADAGDVYNVGDPNDQGNYAWTGSKWDKLGDTIDLSQYALRSELPGDYAGATSIASGTHGLVPAATSANRDKFLRGDGTWSEAGGVMSLSADFEDVVFPEWTEPYHPSSIPYMKASVFTYNQYTTIYAGGTSNGSGMHSIGSEEYSAVTGEAVQETGASSSSTTPYGVYVWVTQETEGNSSAVSRYDLTRDYKPILMSDLIAAGPTGIPLIETVDVNNTGLECPNLAAAGGTMYVSCEFVETSSMSLPTGTQYWHTYKFTFTVRPNTVLIPVADLDVTNSDGTEDRVDLTPLLSKIGGEVVVETSTDQDTIEPVALITSDEASSVESGRVNVLMQFALASSEEDLFSDNDTALFCDDIYAQDDGTAVVHFSAGDELTAIMESDYVRFMAMVNSGDVSGDDAPLTYINIASYSGATPVFTDSSLSSLLDGWVELTAWMTGSSAPTQVEDALPLKIKALSESGGPEEGLSIALMLGAPASRTTHTLRLSASAEPGVDLDPLVGDAVSDVSVSVERAGAKLGGDTGESPSSVYVEYYGSSGAYLDAQSFDSDGEEGALVIPDGCSFFTVTVSLYGIGDDEYVVYNFGPFNVSDLENSGTVQSKIGVISYYN